MKRNHTIREEDICRFSRHLHDLEYAPGSIEKYLRDLTAFQHWLAGRTVTQREIAAWKDFVELDMGTRHTVGSLADGTVVAVGDNAQGQCDVSDWTDLYGQAPKGQA